MAENPPRQRIFRAVRELQISDRFDLFLGGEDRRDRRRSELSDISRGFLAQRFPAMAMAAEETAELEKMTDAEIQNEIDTYQPILYQALLPFSLRTESGSESYNIDSLFGKEADGN